MLEQLREQVCNANRELEHSRLIVLTWGNVSGLDRDSALVVMKPSGVPAAALRPQDMVVVDLDGKVVEGTLKPSSDTPTHLVLYRSLRGIGGVTHTHSACATAFAQAQIPIPCLGTTHADIFHGEVPVTRMITRKEVEEAYEANTGKVIVDRFISLNHVAVPGVLVAGHGPFTWGKTAQESLDNSIALEEIARMALATIRLKSDVQAIPTHLLDKHYHRKHGPGAYYGQKPARQ